MNARLVKLPTLFWGEPEGMGKPVIARPCPLSRSSPALHERCLLAAAELRPQARHSGAIRRP